MRTENPSFNPESSDLSHESQNSPENPESVTREKKYEKMMELRHRLMDLGPTSNQDGMIASFMDGKDSRGRDYEDRHGDERYPTSMKVNRPTSGKPLYPEKDSVYFEMQTYLNEGLKVYRGTATLEQRQDPNFFQENYKDTGRKKFDLEADYSQTPDLEATLVGIESLRKQGNQKEAQRIGREFLARRIEHYKSTFESRLDDFLRNRYRDELIKYETLSPEEAEKLQMKRKAVQRPLEDSNDAMALKKHYLEVGEELFAKAQEILSKEDISPLQTKHELDDLFSSQEFAMNQGRWENRELPQVRSQDVPTSLTRPFEYDQFIPQEKVAA